jgi:hypothetical protein
LDASHTMIHVRQRGVNGGSTNPEVLVFVVILVVGELLDGAAPGREAAEGTAGESIEAAREEEESCRRDKRLGG